MAMMRIIYPYSWHNVREHQFSYTLLCKANGLPWALTIYLPSGIYRTVKDVIHGIGEGTSQWIKKTLARALGYLNHQYNIPQLYQIGTFVQQNDDQSVLLVSTTTTLVRKEELVRGLLSPYAFQTMYVYSDLVESQVVGDTQANLFHILVPRGEPGDVVAEEIKLLTYHRLRTSVFSSVKINIRGDTGEPIPFDSGTVRVTLHFRRRASF